MDVRCARCQSNYDFDDARIPPRGVNVKCTTCGHVFRVHRSRANEPVRQWMVRQPSGKLLTCPDLSALQKSIAQGKVSREDEISRTGTKWKRLGDIGELASLFPTDEQAPAVPVAQSLDVAPLTPAPEEQLLAPPSTTQEFEAPAELSSLDGLARQMAPMEPPAPGDPFAPQPVPTDPFAGQPAPTDPLAGQPVPTDTLAGQPAPTDPFAGQPIPTDPFAGQPIPTDPFAGQPVLTDPFLGQPVATDPFALQPASTEQVSLQPTATELASAPGSAAASGAAPQSTAAQPPAKDQGAEELPDDSAIAKAALGGGPSRLMLAAVVMSCISTLGALGYFLYAFHYRPGQVAKSQEVENARRPHEAPVAKAAPDARMAVASVDAGAAVPDAGTGAQAGKQPPPISEAASKASRAYASLMAEADRLRRADDAEEALQVYARAVALAPERPEPVAGRGLCFLDLDRYGEAEAAFLRALKLNSRYGVALMGLAETYRVQQRKEEAIKFYRQYLEIAPDGPDSRVARVAIERLQK